MMEDTDSSTNPTGETTATNHRRDAETRSFGKSDDALDDRARDATAETLVDIMKLTRGGTSPNAARARERRRQPTDTRTKSSFRRVFRLYRGPKVLIRNSLSSTHDNPFVASASTSLAR